MQELKYEKIGTGYNSTRKADLYLTDRLYALLNPQKDELYLDLGCGTGNYTVALSDRGVNFIGVEPSETMLKEAKMRNKNINWQLGKAEQIPSKDKVFNGVIATLTIHHWTDLKKSFQEISRVISHGGRIVIFTATPEQMAGYWLNHYFPKMIEASIFQMPSFDSIIEASANVGFELTNTEKYFIKNDLQDFFLYVGKNKPELYLNEQVRKGISSFSSLSNVTEVQQGLQKLKSDLNGGFFEDVAKKYHNDIGDYIFITLRKKDST